MRRERNKEIDNWDELVRRVEALLRAESRSEESVRDENASSENNFKKATRRRQRRDWFLLIRDPFKSDWTLQVDRSWYGVRIRGLQCPCCYERLSVTRITRKPA
jgi:hypothetical protein